MARKSTAAPAEPVESEPTDSVVDAEPESTAAEAVVDAGTETVDEIAAEAPAEPRWWEKAEGVSAFQGVTSEDDAIARVRQLEAERHQAAQYADYYARQLQQSAIQQAQTPKPEEKPVEPWWKKHYSPPEFNPAWRQEWLQSNPATGAVEFKPDTPPDIKQKIIEHARFQREQREKFESNPLEYVYQGLAEKIREDARAEAMQAVQGHQLTQQFYALRSADADWLFGKDAAGNPDVNQPTPANMAFRQFLQPLIQAGLPLEQAWATARERTAHRFPAQPAQSVADVNGQKKKEHVNRLNGAGRLTNRSGTIAAAADPRGPAQNPLLSWGEMAKQNAAAMGLDMSN